MEKIKEILAQFEETFDDRKLSRGERQALNQILADVDLNDQNTGYLRNRIFEFAKQNLKSYSSLQVLEWLENANKIIASQGPADHPPSQVYFSPGHQCQQAIIRHLREAKKEILICVFTISDDHITREILASSKRNLNLRLITDDDKTFDKGSDIRQLAREGVAVKMDDTPNHMHHKFALIDQEILITGSYNWTRSAAKYNHENILISWEKPIIEQYRKEFERLWKEFVDFH